MASMQAFFDESGYGRGSDSPAFVLAGYLATAPQWAAFSKEWKPMLDYYRIGRFKMAEANDRWLNRGEV